MNVCVGYDECLLWGDQRKYLPLLRDVGLSKFYEIVTNAYSWYSFAFVSYSSCWSEVLACTSAIQDGVHMLSSVYTNMDGGYNDIQTNLRSTDIFVCERCVLNSLYDLLIHWVTNLCCNIPPVKSIVKYHRANAPEHANHNVNLA